MRTLPLSVGNYGGILQAYALQCVLRQLQLSPATDLSVSNPRPVADVAERIAIRSLPSSAFSSKQATDLRDYVFDKMTSDRLNTFVKNNIVGVELYNRRGKVDRNVLEQFDKFVAGSDQIWRRDYGDVKSYLFDFVDNPNATMISYAASFGHDSLTGYQRRTIRAAKPLAQRFHALSVREKSAVSNCGEYWGINARHHVDPTMLIDPRQYRNLADQSATELSQGLLTYVLDDSAPTRSFVSQLCDRLGLTETRLVNKPTSYAAWKADPDGFLKPSVETWLKAFSDAEFVVTDSFHGTVFAILNNKPFVAISNPKRGAGRFISLLEMFGLQDRLISAADDRNEARLSRNIDWAAVNDRLAVERARGISYLDEFLANS